MNKIYLAVLSLIEWAKKITPFLNSKLDTADKLIDKARAKLADAQAKAKIAEEGFIRTSNILGDKIDQSRAEQEKASEKLSKLDSL